jgi:hypothetical protein
MATTALTDRYAANLYGVSSRYDRIIVTGTRPGACCWRCICQRIVGQIGLPTPPPTLSAPG